MAANGKFSTVGVDVRMYRMSGIGRYLRSLLPALIERTDCHYTLYGYGQDEAEMEKFPRAEFVRLTSRIYHPKEHFELKKKIKPCDLYFSPHFIQPVFRIPAKRRVSTVHDVFHISDVSIYNPLQKLYMKTLYKRCIARADKVITVSGFSRSEIERYIPAAKGKIAVIPNYIDGKVFYRPEKAELDQSKREFAAVSGFDPGREFILYVGNIKPHKNLLRLVKAFGGIKNRSLSLLIVGGKEGFIGAEKDFDSAIAGNPNIVFTGKVSDRMIRMMYSLAKFFVFPSYYEGFGYPPLEAMACGSAAACSGIEVIREMCGDAAYYFDPMSADDITRAVDTLDTDAGLRKELAVKGAKQAAKYTFEANIKSHIEVLFGE
ncbi:MAG: hypothetical protein A2Y33_16275 [Spirochaetes bacterium GWF1_51_8]|nr:MAG: hypothetical protein A2Y33_16275 [Spirochaetes bacterium GWF1_51_8]